MKTSNFNLQLLRHSDVFATREEAMRYLTERYKPNSLEAEPVLVMYGTATDPSVILAVGTKTATDTVVGGFYAVDMTHANERIEGLETTLAKGETEAQKTTQNLKELVKAIGLEIDENKIKDQITYNPDIRDEVIGSATTVLEAVNLLSRALQEETKKGVKVPTKNTDSVTLLSKVDSDGVEKLEAIVELSKHGINEDKKGFNNNIIGTLSDGLFAGVHVEYDDARNQLIFTTSGYTDNGTFKTDAVVEKVKLGGKFTVNADNTGHNVEVAVTNDATQNIATVSADVKLSVKDNNILVSETDGLFVGGTAKNIKTGDGKTVADVLKSLEDRATALEEYDKQDTLDGRATDTAITTVENHVVKTDVKLSSDETIVVANGGLSVNLDCSVNALTNTLLLKLGNNTKTIDLPGASIVKNVRYDKANKTLYVEFNGVTQQVAIPLGEALKTIDVKNVGTNPIQLTLESIAGSLTDHISATLNLRSNDNLIGNENGYLFVSEQNIVNKINTTVDSKVSNERDERSAETTAIRQELNAVKSQVQTTKDDLTSVFNDKTAQVKREAGEALDTFKNLVYTPFKESVESEKERQNAVETRLSSSVETNTNAIANIVSENLRTTAKIEEVKGTVASNKVEIENSLRSAIDGITRVTTAQGEKIEEVKTTLGNSLSDVKADVVLVKSNYDTIASVNGKIVDAKAELTTKIDKVAENLANGDQALERKIVETKDAITQSIETKAATLQTKADASAVETRLTDAIATKIGAVRLERKDTSGLTYHLMVDNVEAGEVNIPKDQFLESVRYDSDEKNLVFDFQTTTGKVQTKVDVSSLVTIYTATDGVTKNGNTFSVKLGQGERRLRISEGALVFQFDGDELSKKANTDEVNALKSSIDKLNADVAGLGISDKIREAIDGATASVVTKSDLELVKNTVTTKADKSYVDGELQVVKNTVQGLPTMTILNQELEKKIGKVEIVPEVVGGVANPLVYVLKVDGVLTDNKINIAKADLISDIQYDNALKALKIKTKSNDESQEREVVISISDLVDTYTAGDGIKIENDKISVRLATNEKRLKLNDGTLSLDITSDLNAKANADDVYTKGVSDATFATKADKSELSGKIDANTLKLNTLGDTYITKVGADDKFLSKADAVSDYVKKTELTTTYPTKVDVTGQIQTAKNEVTALIPKGGTTPTITITKQTANDGSVELVGNLRISEVPGINNLIETNAHGGIYITCKYDASSNKLIFNDGPYKQEIQLSDGKLIESGTYNNVTKEIVLNFKDRSASGITIPVGDLVKTLSVPANDENPLQLTLKTVGNTDTLTGVIRVHEDDDRNDYKNALRVLDGSLYVSRYAENYLGYYNNTKLSLQEILSKISTETGKITTLEREVGEVKTQVGNTTLLTSRVSELERQVLELKNNTTINTLITELTKRVDELEKKVSSDFGKYGTNPYTPEP